MNSENTPVSPHPPRFCHIVRTPDFQGYGFNLHSIKEKKGQFVGQVDKESPAERALLKEGDRIVEVNGVNISSESHKQVVSRVKLVPEETRLLVVDAAGDKWYKERNIVITADMTGVVRGSSVTRRESSTPSESKSEGRRSEDRRSVASANSVSSTGTSDASNRQDQPIQENGVATAVDGKESSAEEFSDDELPKDEVILAEKVASIDLTEDKKRVSSDSSDDDNIAKELIANDTAIVADEKIKEAIDEVAENRENLDAEVASTNSNIYDQVSKHESESDSEVVTSKVVQNGEASTVQESAADQVAPKPVDEDSQSSKSNHSRRSLSVSSASSRGSAGNSHGTDPVADKSPISASPSPPSSTGAPSPTPTPAPNFNSKNMDGLNMNMSAVEMRAYLASRKKRDIRHTEIDLRKKYEIVQRL